MQSIKLYGDIKLNIHEQRIEKLRSRFNEKQIDGLLVFIGENRFYLSGFKGEDSQFDETAGFLVIGKEKLVLATDSRFTFQAKSEAPLYDVYCYKDFTTQIADIMDIAGIKKAGFESARISVDTFEKIKSGLKKELTLKPVTGIVEELRVIKDENEIDIMRKSLHKAEKSLKDILKDIQPGMTEKEGAWLLEKTLRDMGAEALSFSTITASGKNSAMPHAIPSDKIFEEKEPILFDWGIILDSYCSDITRTFCLDSNDGKFKKIFSIVKKAQDEATKAICAGITGKEVDAIARKIIIDAGYGDFFGHGLGHGVGLAVHESPRLSPLYDKKLEEGMVVTIEPGIYLPNWGGIRLENMAVVRKDGAELLNSTTPEEFLL